MAPRTLLDFFADHVASKADENYLHQPVNRQFRTFTWAEVDRQARCLAAGLQAQGFSDGDRVAILSKNCAE